MVAELAALGKRDSIHGRAGTYIKKIYDRLLIDFSFNSSRFEGNTYSLADTEKLLLQGAVAPGKPNAERIMILNHKEAIAYLVRDVPAVQVDEPTIRTLHYLHALGRRKVASVVDLPQVVQVARLPTGIVGQGERLPNKLDEPSSGITEHSLHGCQGTKAGERVHIDQPSTFAWFGHPQIMPKIQTPAMLSKSYKNRLHSIA